MNLTRSGLEPTKTILLLEDQNLVRAGMRALIHICEPTASISEASSCLEAIELLRRGAFDIAFLDIDLRNAKSGLDVLAFIQEEGIDTRPVMLSGRSEKDVVMSCLAKGASGYILKDMDGDGLFRRALDTVMQGGIFLPASVLGRGGFSPPISTTPQQSNPSSLGITGRSLEVLYYLCQGLPNKAIARKMGIEEKTIRNDYNTRLYRLLRVASRTELIVEVARRGMVVEKPEGLHSGSQQRASA